MIQIWQVPSECGPSNLVVLALLSNLKKKVRDSFNFWGLLRVSELYYRIDKMGLLISNMEHKCEISSLETTENKY